MGINVGRSFFCVGNAIYDKDDKKSIIVMFLGDYCHVFVIRVNGVNIIKKGLRIC